MATDFETAVLYYEKLPTATLPFSERFDELIRLVDSLQSEGESKGGLRERDVPESARDHWYTRVAACITQFVAQCTDGLNYRQLEAICARKQTIAYIFAGSGYRGMSHLISLVAKSGSDGKKTLDKTQAAVIFAFLSIDDLPEELIDAALQQSPQVLRVLLLGWLNTRAVLTPVGERNRSRLLASGHLVAKAAVKDSDIPQIVNAWMYASYAESPVKHGIKAHLNELIRSLITWSPPQIACRAVATGPSKPLIVVVHERFTEVHAMYRCYAPSISDLQKHFRLIAVAEVGFIDEAGEKLFESTIKISGHKNLREIASTIAGLQPDMVYYPSLGMSHWTVVLAQLRLAPVQVMTHGHPATSMSDQIDYAYVGHMDSDVSALHSEFVIVGPTQVDFEPHFHMPDTLPAPAVPTDRQVRIAVNSKVMKLSSRLIDMCNRLAAAAASRVQFVFFPGERGLYFDGLEAAIKTRVPDAQVVAYCSYDDFLKELCTCDLALAAFPFGNTNSTVDTCLLGIPTVAHYGPEGHSQSDRMVIETAGLARWLVCDSDESYFQTALQLIDNPQKRVEAINGLNREQIYDNFFASDRPKKDNPFADVFVYLYKNHEALQASPERVLSYKQVIND